MPALKRLARHKNYAEKRCQNAKSPVAENPPPVPGAIICQKYAINGFGRAVGSASTTTTIIPYGIYYGGVDGAKSRANSLQAQP